MKTILFVLVALASNLVWADTNLALTAGSTATISPGDKTTVVCAGAGPSNTCSIQNLMEIPWATSTHYFYVVINGERASLPYYRRADAVAAAKELATAGECKYPATP